MEHEALKQNYELLKTRHSTLQYQLDADKEESQLKYVSINLVLQQHYYHYEQQVDNSGTTKC